MNRQTIAGRREVGSVHRTATVRYGRWRDAEGTHVPDDCRVQQVGVYRPHGGAHARLGHHGRGDRPPVQPLSLGQLEQSWRIIGQMNSDG